ncbi:IPT/TIG domain-containing protein [Patescibacteria group bacterium]
MNFKKTIEKTSYKTLFGAAIVFAMVLMIPITVYLNQQETKIVSEAYFEKPKPPSPTPTQYGEPSFDTPQITLVWPFLGKVGDSVLIHGTNFGDNPRDKSLVLGSQVISEKSVISWTPELIEFSVPTGTREGTFELINLTVTGQKTTWNHPFTVYSQNTKVQVKKPDNHLQILNGSNIGKIVIDFGDGTQTETKLSSRIPLSEEKTIVSLKILDQNDTSVPFFVNPIEFGF